MRDAERDAELESRLQDLHLFLLQVEGESVEPDAGLPAALVAANRRN